MNVAGLQLYIVQLAEKYVPSAVDVASALNIAAFNIGIAIGASVGGVVADSTATPMAYPEINRPASVTPILKSSAIVDSNPTGINSVVHIPNALIASVHKAIVPFLTDDLVSVSIV